MIDELEIAYVFLRIMRCYNGIGYAEKPKRKIWTREWLLKRNERGLSDKEDFRK